jgi:hypothetical protein
MSQGPVPQESPLVVDRVSEDLPSQSAPTATDGNVGGWVRRWREHPMTTGLCGDPTTSERTESESVTISRTYNLYISPGHLQLSSSLTTGLCTIISRRRPIFCHSVKPPVRQRTCLADVSWRVSTLIPSSSC